MDDNGEDCVYFGRALEREEGAGGRKLHLAVAEGRAKQAVPPWQQEARDDEGRRRFHGAFTGGFSAGYFNSVGSKEGWQPASFRSSRSQRAEVQPQRVEALMDADERHDAQRGAVAAQSAFDTFGFTAAERARQLAPAADRRPSVIPGGAVAELLAPAADSIGKALLRRMGWREGRGLGPDEVAASRKVQREGRRAMLALAAGGRGRGEGGGDDDGEAEGDEDDEEGDAWGGREEIVGKGRGARGGKDGGGVGGSSGSRGGGGGAAEGAQAGHPG
ncbi:unnamed protein product, partial [Closterium sp. Naga37s-1]